MAIKHPDKSGFIEPNEEDGEDLPDKWRTKVKRVTSKKPEKFKKKNFKNDI